MTFEEWWKGYTGSDKDKSLVMGKVYAQSAWDYQQARIEALVAGVRNIVNEKKTYKRFNSQSSYDSAFAAYDRMHDAIDALAALLDSEPSAHTCNASCQLPACVLRRRVEALEAEVQAYRDIRSDSTGVAGYYPNGDSALWDEFDIPEQEGE